MGLFRFTTMASPSQEALVDVEGAGWRALPEFAIAEEAAITTRSRKTPAALMHTPVQDGLSN